ncbi:hypothetical protein COLAER_01121 [Collinsella aerofaciens ATCC 25986]|uniref:Uncharacterized protein n=1 Tax=Collinsella aerofaciens (strain ATCC 25986 / DSM 3979 / JCM 10188 / KCTC 3647 / NCTC 11838 / VPI 1003) TaxID=411903 RepID=A4E9M1_COLAA|nr:hypothetical protein COLAER_01121 [Collinsella aerofaciens ATCC 25986]
MPRCASGDNQARSDVMLGMGRAKDAKRKTFNENGVKTTSVMA